MAGKPDHRAVKPPGRFKAALLGMISGWYGRHVVLGDPFNSLLSGGSSYAGERVTINSALQLGTVWACVRLISETVSTMPFGMYRRKADGTREFDSSHALYPLLHDSPNADMTSVSFWQAFVASMLLWGAAYVEKKLSGKTAIGFEFLMPDCVSREREGNTLVWKYTDPATGTKRTIPDDRMWVTPAFSLDGINGLSPVAYGAHVFGGAMAAEKAAGETFKNGMKSPGLVTMDSFLKQAQRDEIRAHVKTVWTEGGVMVLEKGAGYHPMSMKPQDAELLATREYGAEVICSWFLVPPHMVGHTSKSTSWGTGIEQQMIGFVTFVLRPWCVRIEQSIRKNLLTPVERLTLSAEFALEGLLRGDSASRAAFYASAAQNGWKTRNEIRRFENDPPVEGGDVLTVQSNLLPIDMLGKAPAANTAQDALKAWLGIEPTAKETTP